MTVTLKATYGDTGTTPDYSGGYRKDLTIPGPFAFGDLLVAISWSGNRTYAVFDSELYNGYPTQYLWEQRSNLYGEQAQASIWTHSITDAEASLSSIIVNFGFDGGDPYRLVILHFDGAVQMEVLGRYRDGAVATVFPEAVFDVDASPLAGEKLLYMVGSRDATDVPTSSRGTQLYHAEAGHSWSVWMEDIATTGDVTVSLDVPERSGHVHYVVRFLDPLTPFGLALAGENRMGNAPLIEVGQTSEPTSNLEFTVTPFEPIPSGWNDTTLWRPAWWKCQPDSAGWYKFDTELTKPYNSLNVDTILSVWWIDPTNGRKVEIKSDDDSGIFYTSIANCYLSAGATYYIKVETYVGVMLEQLYVLRASQGDPEPIVPAVQPPDPPAKPEPIQSLGRASFSAV